MPLSQKIAVSGIFTICGFILIITALHVVTIIQVLHTLDVTYFIVPLGLWGVIECNVGILLACLPSMLPLLRLAMNQRYRSSSARSKATPYATPTTRSTKKKPYWLRSNEEQDTELGVTAEGFERLEDVRFGGMNEGNRIFRGDISEDRIKTVIGEGMELEVMDKRAIVVRSDVDWEFRAL